MAACGGVSTASSSPSTTTPSNETPSGSAAPPVSPTPVASPLASPTLGILSCRLPVWGWALPLGVNQGVGYVGGFVAVPGGQFTLAQETLTNGQVDAWAYSTSLARWLPVRRQAVSPDGMQYAYVEYMSNGSQPIHIVDGRTNTDRVLVASGDLDFPDWQNDGLYVVHHFIGSDFGEGLARVDRATGEVTEIAVPQLTGSRSYWTVDGDAAWATDWGSGTSPQFGISNRLQRYDLSTGQLATWFYSSGKNIRLNGFTATHLPMAEIADVSGADLINMVEVTLKSPNTIASALTLPGLPTIGPSFEDVIPDSGRLWLLVNGGIWLLPAGGSPVKVSEPIGFWGISGTSVACG